MRQSRSQHFAVSDFLAICHSALDYWHFDNNSDNSNTCNRVSRPPSKCLPEWAGLVLIQGFVYIAYWWKRFGRRRVRPLYGVEGWLRIRGPEYTR